MKHLLSDLEWGNIDVDHVVEHSFRDFHAKGLDYLCLSRTKELTVKAYFFADGMDSQEVSEVINPHNHRYDFLTQCFSGEIRNKWYRPPPCWDGESKGDECGPMYDVYEWRTPLLGGNGFTHVDAVPLQLYRQADYKPGGKYNMYYDQYHTIQVLKPETCIVLLQFEDWVPPEQPTLTFTRGGEPPSLDGLYNRFTADQAVKRLELLRGMADKL